MDIAEADVPMLLELESMDRERLVSNIVLNELQAPYHGWSLPIVRKYGHLYLEWSSKHILYTRPELLKLQRHCRHPSKDRIYALIKRAMPKQADSTTRRILEGISKSCETCQISAFRRSASEFHLNLMKLLSMSK